MQLLFSCQQNQGNNLMCHPVNPFLPSFHPRPFAVSSKQRTTEGIESIRVVVVKEVFLSSPFNFQSKGEREKERQDGGGG